MSSWFEKVREAALNSTSQFANVTSDLVHTLGLNSSFDDSDEQERSALDSTTPVPTDHRQDVSDSSESSASAEEVGELQKQKQQLEIDRINREQQAIYEESEHRKLQKMQVEDARISKKGEDAAKKESSERLRSIITELQKQQEALDAEEKKMNDEDEVTVLNAQIQMMIRENSEKDARLKERKTLRFEAAIEEQQKLEKKDGELPSGEQFIEDTTLASSLTGNSQVSKSQGVPQEGSALTNPNNPVLDAERTVLGCLGITDADVNEAQGVSGSYIMGNTSMRNSSNVTFTIARTKSEICNFSGDVVDYAEWKDMFQSYMDHYPTAEHLDTLKEKLGKCSSVIAGCSGHSDAALIKAWNDLDAHFMRLDRVSSALLTQIDELVSTPYTNDTDFILTVKRLRDRVNRLIRADKLAMMGLNSNTLKVFANHTPDWIFKRLNKLYFSEPHKWNFMTVLKLVEGYAAEIESQSFLREPSGPKESVQNPMSLEAEINHLSSDLKGKSPRPDMTNPWAKCMLCDCENHLTIKCTVTRTADKLKALSWSHKICELCGRPGHRSVHCPILTLGLECPTMCKSEECNPDKPHSKVFCLLNKKA